MQFNNKLKIFNDPVYGFITIPSALIFSLIEHQYFQRLRRITQMGLSYLVYPGAHHTRFHHALGSIYLMQKAVRVLRFKGVDISLEEENALYIAILLHDIGHGPFSHAMEHSIVFGISHETISLYFMEALNKEFNGALDMAISIFKGDYSKKFMCQLISGQLDMDRADYLKRDSFYTGVAEGNINSDRLINMLHVVNNELVIEEKGIYSVEKFLVSRRFMYWQVYLHKTGLVAEQLLIRLLQRAKTLYAEGVNPKCNPSLSFFLANKIDRNNFTQTVLEKFAKLDDYDIISAIKIWQYHNDFVLSELSKMLLHRDLLKIKIKTKPVNALVINNLKQKLCKQHNITAEEASYFVFKGEVSNLAYNQNSDDIKVYLKTGKVKSIFKVSHLLKFKAINKTVSKYYICYPKNIN